MTNETATIKKYDDTKMSCGYCKHFIRHHVKLGSGNYLEIDHGHCIKPRIKNRRINDKACAYWQEKEEE